MDDAALRGLLDEVAAGRTTPDAAAARLRRLPFADLGYARIDHHRSLRQGLPEAVYGPGKTPEQVAGIVTELLAHGDGPVIVSRASAAQAKAALATCPAGVAHGVHADAGGLATLVWRPRPRGWHTGTVLVAAAGTADLAVADECAAVLEAHGVIVERLTDVGVAGLHRLLRHVDDLMAATVVVAVAGMEGALASVLGGITAAPVIAVPTSVGYGSSLGGITALLSMLASCASGVTVVGIDNGFGAACAAVRVLGPGRDLATDHETEAP